MASPARDARLRVLQNHPNAQVVQRGRGFLRMYDPDSDRFILDTQAGGVGWHYNGDQEVDTAWVQNGPGWEMLKAEYGATLQGNTYSYTDVASGLGVSVTIQSIPQWTNGTQSENAAQINAVNPQANGDAITYPDLLGTSPNLASLSIETQTARLKKLLTVPNDSVFSTPTIGGEVFWSLPLRFNKDAGLDIYIDGVLWDEGANNPKTTTGSVEFRNGNETVFVFSTPYATDANNSQVFGQMVMRKSGANLFADVQIPYSWMQSAIYPIEIDPTIDPQVGAGADDTLRFDSADFSATITWGGIGRPIGSTGGYSVSHRYTGISGLSGVTIDVAYVSYYLEDDGSNTSSTLSTIYADDAEAPTAPTTAGTFDGKTLTTASVSWDGDFGTNSTTVNSPSIVSIIQELADSYDPSEIQIIHKDNASPDNAHNRITLYEGSTSLCPALHVEYSTASTLSIAINPTNNSVQGVKVVG